MNRKTTLVLCLSYFLFLSLSGQVIHYGLSAAGKNATGVSGSVSYSIGQIVTTTSTSATASIAPGVQQAFEINVVTEVNDIFNISLFSVYPNPTNSDLVLKITYDELASFHYCLYDISGKLLNKDKIKENETTIKMASYQPAAYFLKIYSSDKEIKVFKIIKK